jgi:hypothetical protein
MLFVLFLRQNVPMTERVYALVWNKFEYLSKEEMTSKRQVSGLIRVIVAGASPSGGVGQAKITFCS